MPVLNCHFLGRFGNTLFEYAFARAFAERNALELHTDPWIGQQIFEINDPPCRGELPRKDEYDIKDGDRDISYRSYSQQQKCIDLYSREDCRRWFTLKPDIARWASHHCDSDYVAHHRKGDYHWSGSGYPVVSKQAFFAAKQKYTPECPELRFVSEEEPRTDPRFNGDLSFVPDFLTLMHAKKALFRANSSFSWWAAVLGTARIFSPICSHLQGGLEYDVVEFTEGNWPRLAAFPFTTDLFLREI